MKLFSSLFIGYVDYRDELFIYREGKALCIHKRLAINLCVYALIVAVTQCREGEFKACARPPPLDCRMLLGPLHPHSTSLSAAGKKERLLWSQTALVLSLKSLCNSEEII